MKLMSGTVAEWRDERLTGHGSVYQGEGGDLYVGVDCRGSALIDGKEYTLHHVVLAPLRPPTGE